MKTTKILFFSDTHISAEEGDPRAVEVLKKAIIHLKPDITVAGGDIIDCGGFSRFSKKGFEEDHCGDLIIDEYEPANKLLDFVQKHTKQRTVYLCGNHDTRIEQWLKRTENYSLMSLLPMRYLSRDRKDFTWVSFHPGKSATSCHYRLSPNLYACHGWAANKYSAEAHLNKARDISILYGHSHRADFRVHTMWDNRPVVAATAGCLCKLSPKYAHNGSPTEWNLGYTVALVKGMQHHIYPVIINKYKAIMPDGKEIKA
jgi:predicted phosphodiesterase